MRALWGGTADPVVWAESRIGAGCDFLPPQVADFYGPSIAADDNYYALLHHLYSMGLTITGVYKWAGCLCSGGHSWHREANPRKGSHTQVIWDISIRDNSQLAQQTQY